MRVYISGPITLGDREANLRQADDAFVKLRELGYCVLCPHWSARMPGAYDIAHASWIDNDLPWVECADAVLRLPGDSVGADMECAHATHSGIPIFQSVAELHADMRNAFEEEVA